MVVGVCMMSVPIFKVSGAGGIVQLVCLLPATVRFHHVCHRYNRRFKATSPTAPTNGRLPMRRFTILAALVAAFLLPLGCESDPPVAEEEVSLELSRNEFTTRIDAAKLMSDVAKRDESLAALIREASAVGRVSAVKTAVPLLSDAALRDKVAAAAALKLASVNAGEGGVAVAQMIADTKLRDEVLAKMVRGQTKE